MKTFKDNDENSNGSGDDIASSSCLGGITSTARTVPSSPDPNISSCPLKFGGDMTDQRSAEERLRESEERYRSLFESSLEAVYINDFDGNFIDANQAALDLTGYSREEFGSINFTDILDEKDIERAFRLLEEQITSRKRTEPVEFELKRKDGEKVWVEVISSLIMKDSNPYAVQGIARNITERKRMLEAIKESEMRWRSLFESSPEGIAIMDTDGVIIDYNGVQSHILDMPKETVIGKTFFELGLVPEDELERLMDIFERLLAGEDVEPFEVRIEQDDVRLDLEILPGLIRRDGEVVAIQVITKDVTDRKRAEEARLDTEEQYTTIVEKGNDGIVIVQDGKVVFWNEKTLEVGRLAGDDVAESDFIDLISPQDRELVMDRYARRQRGEDVENVYEIHLESEGGPLPVEINANLIEHKGRPATLAFIRDITERKHAEAAEHKQRKKLEVLNRIIMSGHEAADLPSFLETILGSSLELMNFDAGGIYMVDDVGRTAELQCSCGLPDALLQIVGRVDIDVEPYAAIFIRDEPIFSEHYDRIAPEHYELSGIRSLASIPLVSTDGVAGALNIASTDRHTFSDGDKEILRSIGREAGTIISRIMAEEAMRESEERFRELADLLPQTIFEIDADGMIVYVNRHGFDSFGYMRDDMEDGVNAVQMFVPEDRERLVENVVRILEGEMLLGEEYTALRKDGSEFPVIIFSSPIVCNDERVGLRGIVMDISEQKRAADELKASLAEKEVLLKEIHHRVKNNMQIISSMMSLQSNYFDDERIRSVFKESENRVKSMAMIHDRLYRSEDLAHINFTEYIDSLARHLHQNYSSLNKNVELEIIGSGLYLGIDMAVPSGLILNELVSNAFKHAFPDDGKGTVTIMLSHEEDQVEMVVKDDGIGLPEDLDLESSGTLGMELVNTLVEQLEGKMETVTGSGTEFRITFSAGETIEGTKEDGQGSP